MYVSSLTIIGGNLVSLLLADDLLQGIWDLDVELAESLVHLHGAIASTVHVMGDGQGEATITDLIHGWVGGHQSKQGKPQRGQYHEGVHLVRHEQCHQASMNPGGEVV